MKRRVAPRHSAMLKLLKSIKKSEDKLGPLYPILVDAEDNVIDGQHRQAVDRNWPRHKLDISGVQSKIARIVANVQRRKVSPKEKIEMLRDLAASTGWTPEQIADQTGLSVSWVRKYLPPEFKDKKHAELAKKRHSRLKRAKTAVKPAKSNVFKINCPNCGFKIPFEVHLKSTKKRE